MVDVKKEEKFMALVIPMKDADDFFGSYLDDVLLWNKIEEDYRNFRIKKGKTPYNNYIFVNQDEPYAEQVWQIVLDGERKKGGL